MHPLNYLVSHDHCEAFFNQEILRTWAGRMSFMISWWSEGSFEILKIRLVQGKWEMLWWAHSSQCLYSLWAALLAKISLSHIVVYQLLEDESVWVELKRIPVALLEDCLDAFLLWQTAVKSLGVWRWYPMWHVQEQIQFISIFSVSFLVNGAAIEQNTWNNLL